MTSARSWVYRPRALFSNGWETCAVAVAGGVWCWSASGPVEPLVLAESAVAPRLDASVDVAMAQGKVCVNDTDGAVGCWKRDRDGPLRPVATPEYLLCTPPLPHTITRPRRIWRFPRRQRSTQLGRRGDAGDVAACDAVHLRAPAEHLD